MPASAGMTWQLEQHKKISNRTDPKHPKGLGSVRFISVRDRKNKRHDKAAGASIAMTPINQYNKEHALYQ